jgi:O-antigen/teichoic acid export membrane protein
LFSIVFGARWEVSGHYARGLAIALGAQLIAAPLSITLVALEKQTLQLVWDAARVVILFVVIAASASAGASAQTVVWLVGAASAALYAVAWAMSRSCIRATVHIPPPEARGNKFSPS